MEWSYEAAGRRKRLTYPDGCYVDYSWYLGGGMKKIVDVNNYEIAEFTYDSRGRRTGLERGNGVAVTTYGYDTNGRMSSLALNLPGTSHDVTRTISRNPAGQITQRTSSLGAFEYPAPSNNSTLPYGTPNHLNQLTTIGASGSQQISAQYDGRGNFWKENKNGQTLNTHTYDLENHLTQVNSTALLYDPLGRLQRVGEGFHRVYDGPNLIGEYWSAGVAISRYVHGPGPDEPILWSSVLEETAYYFVADERGSVIALADASGAAVAGTQSFDEYGRVANVTGYATSPFGYTGQEFITDLQLNYYKARWYSPQHGRFMSVDPTGYADGPNMYAYVANDPVNLIDDTGLGWKTRLGSEVVEAAVKKAVRIAGEKARDQAWREEKRLVQATGRGTSEWSDAQKRELLQRGKVAGFDGHHINDKQHHPELAGDPNNIEFLPAFPDHRGKGGVHSRTGGTGGTTSGPLLDRTAGGTLPSAVKFSYRDFMGVAGAFLAALQALDIIDPINVLLDPDYGKWKGAEDFLKETPRQDDCYYNPQKCILEGVGPPGTGGLEIISCEEMI